MDDEKQRNIERLQLEQQYWRKQKVFSILSLVGAVFGGIGAVLGILALIFF